MNGDYSKLSHEDFDAIVTGELTHFAIWLEAEIIGIISDYFITNRALQPDFERLVFRRDGLSFQDKIEIARALTPQLGSKKIQASLLSALKQTEEFKSLRNALAHGTDITPEEAKSGLLVVEIVTRSGKEKQVRITPDSHESLLCETSTLLDELQKIRADLNVERVPRAITNSP